MQEGQTYAAKDIYKRLKVSSSTLRKWNLKLEEKGWQFQKDVHGNRIFTDNDIAMLERYKIIVQDQGVHQDIAAHVMCNPTDPNIPTILGIANAASVTERQESNGKLALLDDKMEAVLQVFTGIAEHIQKQDEKIEILIKQNEEMRVYIAASQETKEEPGWIARKLRNFLRI